MLYPEPSTARQVIAYLTALPAAFCTGGGLWWLLTGLRHGGLVARFTARAWIIGGFYFAFGLVMRSIGGPYIFAGRSRDGSYHSDPTTGHDLWLFALIIGLAGALLFPLVSRAKGLDLDM